MNWSFFIYGDFRKIRYKFLFQISLQVFWKGQENNIPNHTNTFGEYVWNFYIFTLKYYFSLKKTCKIKWFCYIIPEVLDNVFNNAQLLKIVDFLCAHIIGWCDSSNRISEKEKIVWIFQICHSCFFNWPSLLLGLLSLICCSSKDCSLIFHPLLLIIPPIFLNFTSLYPFLFFEMAACKIAMSMNICRLHVENINSVISVETDNKVIV